MQNIFIWETFLEAEQYIHQLANILSVAVDVDNDN